MSASGKIRLMLGLLCASLLFTAIIVQNTNTPEASLQQNGKTLENSLHKKEGYVSEQLNNPAKFALLKTLPHNPRLALSYIQDLTTEKKIWFITLNKGQLSFWSGIRVIPDYPASIKDGYSFRREGNGFYEVIKRTEGDFSAIFFIPVKYDFAFVNQYLQNSFAPDLLKENGVEIADFTDKDVYDVFSRTNYYLFSIKVNPGEINFTFFYYELAIWFIAIFSCCLLVNNICYYISDKGYSVLSLLLLAAFIVAMRFVNLHYGWPGIAHRLKAFNPMYYASSPFYPSLGDLCANIMTFCWFSVYLYTLRRKLLNKIPGKFLSYFYFLAGILILILTSTSLVNIFFGLVLNSKISFDVSNVLNLSLFSLLGVLMLCFSFLIFYLFIEVFLTVAFRLAIPNVHKAVIFGGAILLTTVIVWNTQAFSLFYVLWGSLVFLRAYAYRYGSAALRPAALGMIIVVSALISSIKLSYFESVKEKFTRKEFIDKLQLPTDPYADEIFKKIEHRIITDTSIIRYFNDTVQNSAYLKTRLQKQYFNGYLSRYELNVYEFGGQEQSIASDKSLSLGDFKSMVIYDSYKVSDWFYRENEGFGHLRYFAMLPVTQNRRQTGTLVIDLKSKPQLSNASFPGLLVDNPVIDQDDFNGYSYALYDDNKLVGHSGNYVYSLVNSDLTGEVKKYVLKTSRGDGNQFFSRFSSFSHLIYKPSDRNLIVVTREENPIIFGLTSMTFFFVVFLVFAVAVLIIRWLWMRIKILSVKNNKLKWNFKVNFDLILYKTRIQFSMVFAVVSTLVLVGIITFFSISAQYQNQQDKAIKDKITSIVAAVESGAYSEYLGRVDENTQDDFDNFAGRYSTDLTLFDLNGVPLITTQPKIYDNQLQARRMNALAFLNLNKLQESEYVNNETIGRLNYKAAYMPIRDLKGSKYQTVAYLQLPYFSNEADYRERIGSLLNIMINVYALVFIAIGLFAVFIARQITAPLSFIQHSLSKTTYGKKNEPIKWDRNDEIGALVKEYNKMIAALEASAQKLAQSERESAWREMAKQVAHEIKNPLTPLKLGLQLLDKSWRDKDPKFDQKFEKFGKSFVEQIESLSSIASEFSAFAKMPETKLERMNAFDVLSQAVTIFKEMDNIKIQYQIPETPFYINADRDQLLRCFNNLLKNAIEAIPSNKDGIIQIACAVTAKSVLITIADNGEGIPEGLRERIFEPNFTTKSSGTGLGLAFVKNSIENAGGKVWFETMAEFGTTFYLSLPAAQTPGETGRS